MYTKAALVALVASASAIQITSPGIGQSFDISKPITVSWTSVSTDPSVFNLDVVNFATANPPINVTVASDVQTSAGTFTISAGTLKTTGTAFQVDFVSNNEQNQGILANSQQFNLTSSGSTTTSSSSSSSSTTSSTTIPTTTATTTASSTLTTVVPIASATSASNGTAPFTNGTSPSGGSSPSPSAFPGAGASLKVGAGSVLAAVVGVVAFFA